MKKRLTLLFVAVLAATTHAQVLTKSVPIDFYRDASSRSLVGLAARSDGRLVAAPFLTDLKGPALPPLLWSVAERSEGRYWVGAGPQGRLLSVIVDSASGTYTVESTIDLPVSHVFSLAPLTGDSLLAAGSGGAVFLINAGKATHRVSLPVEAVHALVRSGDDGVVFAATGNPGRIYRVDTKILSSTPGSLDPKAREELGKQGVTLLAEVRDRHLKSLTLSKGTLYAGSSPRGNVYAIPVVGGAPLLLADGRDSEVTSLSSLPSGDLLALVVQSPGEGEPRNPPSGGRDNQAPTPNQAGNNQKPTQSAFERFTGKSLLVRLSPKGSPEILTQRNNSAFYSLHVAGDLALIGAGEQGEILGYDLAARLALIYPGTASAQVSGLVPASGGAGVLVIRNNPAGLSLLSSSNTLPRSAETRRLDLGGISTLGAFRPTRIRASTTDGVKVSLRTSRTADEAEGWSAWRELAPRGDGWFQENLVARHVKLRVILPPGETALVERAELFVSPENRRPQVSEFRFLPANYEVRLPQEPLPSTTTTVGNLIGSKKAERETNLGASTAIPRPGIQTAVWTASDADGDSLSTSFFLKGDTGGDWIPIAVRTSEPFAQFSTDPLPEGYYAARLVVSEEAPRPEGDRLSTTLEVDTLTVDRTGPAILSSGITQTDTAFSVRVEAKDNLSLLDRAEFNFNNGWNEKLSVPADSIRDSRHETFELQAPTASVANATAVEITVTDANGNTTYTRLPIER
ncbi:MAG: hypothetical protein SFV32_07920 [Opitutaceae bacterium]|nr:hypothetical protein [Opitutaceae bacterium]